MNYRKDRLVADLISEIQQDSYWLTRDEQDIIRNKLNEWNKMVDEIYIAKGRTN